MITGCSHSTRRRMLNFDDIRRYDEFWQRPPRRYATRGAPWGLWARATVIAKAEGPRRFAAADVQEREVVILGAGPSGMLMAAYLAHSGHQVTLIERQPRLFCGSTWNLARDEFAELARTPPLTEEEWCSCVTGDFEHGVFRLYDHDDGGVQKDFVFADCLNVSLDEGRFYALLARERPGLEVKTGTLGELEELRDDGAYVSWDGAGRSGVIRAELLIDARGWRSSLALAVHPQRQVESVYNMLGVVTDVGLSWGGAGSGRAKRDLRGNALSDARGDPIGVICATYQNAVKVDGMLAQGIVERFTDYVPGSAEHDGRGDVLYYFTRTPAPARLAAMAEGMLAALKDVAPELESHHVRKVFYGHGPGYHAPGPLDRWRVQTSAGDRLLLIGVAAQQYSGLTGCAFGALARNAGRMGRQIDAALTRKELGFAALAGIDIDARERTAQVIGGLFGGTMTVSGPQEDELTPNRDWLIFCQAAARAELDPRLLGEAIKDKMRFETLNKLILMLRLDPRVGEVLLRNNAGSELTAVSAASRGYLWLMLEELRRWRETGDRKYVAGIRAALANLPGVALSAAVVAARHARGARVAQIRDAAPPASRAGS